MSIEEIGQLVTDIVDELIPREEVLALVTNTETEEKADDT